MTLDQVLTQHEAFLKSPLVLKHNLGDGFLCENNSIYRLVRLRVQELGYHFTEEWDNSFVVLPFAQLEKIFESKKIPLVDNLTPLRALPEKDRKVIVWDEIEIGYKKNYLFHESCHVVARAILAKFTNLHPLESLLLEEAFANTCELFAMADAKTKWHKVFYQTNSYSSAWEDLPSLIESIETLGGADSFKWTLMSYLHSNFLFSRFSSAEFKILVPFIFKRELHKKELKSADFLSQMAFSLDESFKQLTRSLHFKLNHYDESEFNQIRLKYLKRVGESALWANLLDSMAKLFYT